MINNYLKIILKLCEKKLSEFSYSVNSVLSMVFQLFLCPNELNLQRSTCSVLPWLFSLSFHFWYLLHLLRNAYPVTHKLALISHYKEGGEQCRFCQLFYMPSMPT